MDPPGPGQSEDDLRCRDRDQIEVPMLPDGFDRSRLAVLDQVDAGLDVVPKQVVPLQLTEANRRPG